MNDQLTAPLQFPEGIEGTVTQPVPTITEEKTSIIDRILDAHAVAQAYAGQVADPEFAKAVLAKLTRSNVKGSRVEGIHSAEDVIAMLRSVTGWKEVMTSLTDKNITCYQGDLPAETYGNKAFAAYATVREIAHKYGAAGLSTIQAKTGYQERDVYYFCTMMRFPTNVLSVQLKEDESGIVHLHQWFAGPEITSLLKLDDGDTVVRCGVIIPLLPDQRAKQQHGKNYRTTRSD